MTASTLRTTEELVDEAKRILARADRDGFNRESEARFNSLLRLAELNQSGLGLPPDVFGRPRDISAIAERANRRNAELRKDPAAVHFFSGRSVNEYARVMSDFGTRLQQRNFPGVGAVLQMHNFGDLEGRTYAALNEGTGSAGGYTVPIDFWAELIAQLKLYDELFAAARWITTSTGGPIDVPMADDTSDVAATVVENGSIVEGPNPTFTQLQFGAASLWSTGRLKLSVQILQDSPVLYDYLVATFAQRFALGLGASFITTLLASVASFDAASSSVIAPDDLLGLMGAIDPAYAMRGSWLMSWSTWIAVRKLTTTNRYFCGETTTQDPDGRYRLLGRPVYICNSLDGVGAGKRPILYGNMQRFVVRSVLTEQTINKYNEVFMPNHQVGFEGVWRVDAALALAGATDEPIAALYMPLS